MKTLWQFVAPTAKAIMAVMTVTVGAGWGAYAAVSMIARTEAQTVRQELLVLDHKNMAHIDRRFDEIKELIKESR